MIFPYFAGGGAPGDYQNLDNFSDSYNSSAGITCGTVFDISKYVPLWVNEEKLQRQLTDPTNSFSVFDFVQLYYDWLYCDGPSGAGYMLSDNLLNLVDIEKTNSEFFSRFLEVYLPGIPTELLDGTISNQNFVNFIKGIRTNLYHQKSTPEGIKYFFKVLFGVNHGDIEIYEPKQNMLRLNGGRFSNSDFKFVGGSTGSYSGENPLYNLAGSYLNGSRIQDGDWIHNYSYLLKTGMTADLYKESYLNIMHPAGLRIVFEKTMSDYVGPTEDGGGDGSVPTVCEYPILRNYGAYRIDTIYPLLGTGPNGMTLYGLSQCNGCTYPGFTGPSHYFPSWAEIITPPPTKFKDVLAFEFFSLCIGGTSPNEVLTCTGC